MKAAVLTAYGRRRGRGDRRRRHFETGEKIGNVVISVAGPAAQAR